MEHIHWIEKSIEFQNLIDDPTIHKPTLVQSGDQPFIVGVKINGQFIMASPCKVHKDRFIPMEQEIVLSSKHKGGLWKVISKVTSEKVERIHRLTTKDIERIYRQGIKNQRITPRSYICTKEIEAFDLIFHRNDPTVFEGQRIVRQMKRIEKNIQFEICDVGEIQYTPTESERTSQDYVTVPRSKSRLLLALLTATNYNEEKLIRNRVLRSLYCVTKNESDPRHFFLEVNQKPCDIHPIASEGSSELRCLHSTQNLFNYISNHQNNTFLFVKLLRGKIPIKAIESYGYMLLKNVLIGDLVPMCRITDYTMFLVNPDLPVRVKLPTYEYKWHSLFDIRKAELKCMQLSLTLVSQDESEIYVIVGDEKVMANYFSSDSNQQQQLFITQRPLDKNEKYVDEIEIMRYSQMLKSKNENNIRVQLQSTKNFSNDNNIISNQQTIKLPKSIPLPHLTSDKVKQNHNKQLKENGLKTKRRHSKKDGKPVQVKE
ncbi:unnamed protein product [Rotaria sp. Silwood1]|nr:unnamed protein product [Rotaria sp. Silwood1]